MTSIRIDSALVNITGMADRYAEAYHKCVTANTSISEVREKFVAFVRSEMEALKAASEALCSQEAAIAKQGSGLQLYDVRAVYPRLHRAIRAVAKVVAMSEQEANDMVTRQVARNLSLFVNRLNTPNEQIEAETEQRFKELKENAQFDTKALVSSTDQIVSLAWDFYD